MLRKNYKGIIIGIIIGLLFSNLIVFADNAVKQINATYRNIRLVVDNTLIIPKDANGVSVEPFISSGTTYLPVRAVAEALGKEVNWDGNTNTVYVGKWNDKPYKEMPVWDTPYLERENEVKTSVEGKDDFIDFHVGEATKGNVGYVVYPTNGLAKEIKGTIIGSHGEVKFNFYDESDNLLYTSPLITKSISGYDFSFQVKNILQIKIEVVRTAGFSGEAWSASPRIKNFRLVTTDY